MILTISILYYYIKRVVAKIIKKLAVLIELKYFFAVLTLFIPIYIPIRYEAASPRPTPKSIS